MLLGGAVGFERELHGRPAGLRTHVLVCLSATMLVLISHGSYSGELDLGEAGRLVFDPNRMGAGIVTGIGFLGAATVLRSGDLLRGLTTAACIWFVAGLGIVLGNGNFALGIVATAIVLVVLTLAGKLTHVITPVIYRRLIVISKRPDADALMNEIRVLLHSSELKVLDVVSGRDNDEGKTELIFYVSLRNRFQMPSLSEKVAAVEGVVSARWKLITVPH